MKLHERILKMLPLLLLILFWDYAQYQYVCLRGLSEWPTVLFRAGLLVLCVVWICAWKWTPVFIAGGYLIGFFAGWIFQRDGVDPGGGGTNNFWAIWLCVYVSSIIVGLLVDMFLILRKRLRK